MRTLIGAGMVAAMVGLVSGSSAGATPYFGYSSDAGVRLVQYGGGRYCERLRRACIYKEERGETGEGNCRRYRSECGGGPSYCEQLRRACMYKDERGETGLGNCRRYRNECGGSRY